jgi:hypothetical protein
VLKYFILLKLTRIYIDFACSLKRRSQSTANGSSVPLSITAATSTGAFTAVVDALVDPLCEEDVVLGKDWIDYCASNNSESDVSPQVDLLPVYYSGELVLINLRDFLHGFHCSFIAFSSARAIWSSIRFFFSGSCYISLFFFSCSS